MLYFPPLTKLNLDLPPGEKARLQELKDLVADDRDENSYTPEEKQALIDQLIDYRQHKATSARANNIAASHDVGFTVDRFIREVRGIFNVNLTLT